MLKSYLYFYIVILKCYQTAIQYLGNVTLSLVVTPRHDKKLAMLFLVLCKKYSFIQHKQRIIEIEYICQCVVPYNSSKHYFDILSLYAIVFNNSKYGRPIFALRTASTIEGISLYSFLTVSL